MATAMNKADRAHLDRLATLGCIVCHNEGFGHSSANIHHIRHQQGMSRRAPHTEAIPLCPQHHQHGGLGVAIHSGRQTWEAKYGTERELLAQVRELL